MGTRSVEIGRGLAPVESGVGTLISFSTQPGNVALDGSRRSSPFAGALLKRIASSRDDLSALFIDVRNDVRKDTQNKQTPWEHSALTARFYAMPQITVSPQIAPTQSDLNEASREWWRVDKTNIAELETFLRRHGSSPEADYARARLNQLKKQVAIVTPSPPPKGKPPATMDTKEALPANIETHMNQRRASWLSEWKLPLNRECRLSVKF
jgi:Caspase domain